MSVAQIKPARQPLELIIVGTEHDQLALKTMGYKSVRVVSDERSVYVPTAEGWELDPSLTIFDRVILALPHGYEGLRDGLAVRLGDTRCLWVEWPDDREGASDMLANSGPDQLRNAIMTARRMWTDEIASVDDIPDPGEQLSYRSGFPQLDEHGFRFTLPAFMPVIGPYGSGKSILLRQLLVQLWELHKWPCLITAFEEKVKPRYIRDLRRHMLKLPMNQWSEEMVADADTEIRKGFYFLRRKRGAVLNAARLIDRIEYAVKVYGIKVVAIDPVNEIDHEVPKGESKTDYMGRFIMQLKQLADDYGLLMIVCAHPPKDGVEKRMIKGKLLTLNDGADTAHWGNKADIGWCVWRPSGDGPTLLHIDKVKDHEVMGKPTLAELFLDQRIGALRIARMGYGIVEGANEH